MPFAPSSPPLSLAPPSPLLLLPSASFLLPLFRFRSLPHSPISCSPLLFLSDTIPHPTLHPLLSSPFLRPWFPLLPLLGAPLSFPSPAPVSFPLSGPGTGDRGVGRGRRPGPRRGRRRGVPERGRRGNWGRDEGEEKGRRRYWKKRGGGEVGNGTGKGEERGASVPGKEEEGVLRIV